VEQHEGHYHCVKGPICERKLGSVADDKREVPGPQGHHPLGSIQANDQCPRRHLVKVREQRSHPTAHIEDPPGLLKRKLIEQPSGQAHENGGPQVAVGLGLGAVVAGDAETGFSGSVGRQGWLYGRKRTLPAAPSVWPTALTRRGVRRRSLPGPRPEPLTVSNKHLRKEPTMNETLTVRNGIDVDQLLATIDAIKDNPHVASLIAGHLVQH
jgi:hypothetical protein